MSFSFAQPCGIFEFVGLSPYGRGSVKSLTRGRGWGSRFTHPLRICRSASGATVRTELFTFGDCGSGHEKYPQNACRNTQTRVFQQPVADGAGLERPVACGPLPYGRGSVRQLPYGRGSVKSSLLRCCNQFAASTVPKRLFQCAMKCIAMRAARVCVSVGIATVYKKRVHPSFTGMGSFPYSNIIIRRHR